MPTTHNTTNPTRPKWATVGSARRCGDGLRIEIRSGPQAGSYAIGAYDMLNLIMSNAPAPLYQLAPDGTSEPFVCGKVRLSDSGRMLLIGAPGSGHYGALQVHADHITAHYLRGDPRAVPVVTPPEPAPRPEEVRPLPPGTRPGVV